MNMTLETSGAEAVRTSVGDTLEEFRKLTREEKTLVAGIMKGLNISRESRCNREEESAETKQ